MQSGFEVRLGSSNNMIHHRVDSDGVRVKIEGMFTYSEKRTEGIDLNSASDYSTFKSNLECWNADNFLSPISNLDNCYYREIVNMGMRAVPFIYEELKKGPTDLVYALDEIFDNHITDGGFMPLQQSCDLWISILQQIEQE